MTIRRPILSSIGALIGILSNPSAMVDDCSALETLIFNCYIFILNVAAGWVSTHIRAA